MGADFIFGTLPAARLDKKRIRTLEKLIAGTTLREGLWETVADQHSDLRDAVREYAAFWCNSEVGTLSLPDLPYDLYVSGGMSWGDDPTGATPHILHLSEFEAITDQLRAWAVEQRADR